MGASGGIMEDRNETEYQRQNQSSAPLSDEEIREVIVEIRF